MKFINFNIYSNQLQNWDFEMNAWDVYSFHNRWPHMWSKVLRQDSVGRQIIKSQIVCNIMGETVPIKFRGSK